MKVTLLAIGKTQAKYLTQGIDDFLRRLRHYVPVDLQLLPDIKSTRGLSEAQQKEKEGVDFMAQLTATDRVVLLDERGREYTSREFSEMLQKEMLSGVKRLVFVIGGPYGFSEAMYARADALVSFSRMTFSHEMIRLFFVEQVYRAMTILRGEPYHHD